MRSMLSSRSLRAAGATLVLLALALLVSARAVRSAEDGFPPGATLLPDITYCAGSGEPLKFDLYQPAGADDGSRRAAVVFIHGGGWHGGDKRGTPGMDDVPALVAHGYLVASINYRHAPRHLFPAPLVDVKCAIRFLRSEAARYGIDPHRIAAFGASAGGHLAALAGLTSSEDGFDTAEHGAYASQVQAVADFYGPADLLAPDLPERSGKIIAAAFGAGAGERRRGSPVHYVAPGAPPFLIVHGADDRVVPVSQSRAFRTALEAANVDVEYLEVAGAGHVLRPSGNSMHPPREEVTRRLVQFLDRTIGPPVRAARPSAAQPRPATPIRNVVVIMGDDHSPSVLGAYGNEIVRTPNLDRLAADGIRFDAAYTNSPVCTPSRQSLLTGLFPHATGVTLLSTPLSPDTLTVAEHLRALGFRTGAVGKMHFIDEERTHGFEYRVRAADHERYLAQVDRLPPLAGRRVRGPWRPFKDPAEVWLNADMLPAGVAEEHSEGAFFARRAIEFLRQHADERFLLFVSFNEPHSPFNFPLEYAGRYSPERMPLPVPGPEDARWMPQVFAGLDEREKRGIVASYYTSVEFLDANVGRVLRELEELKLSDSTLVIYTSDNGYLLGDHGRFEKHMMWEPAVRVPLIVRHPRFGGGRETGAFAELVDLVPTILDALSVAPMPRAHGRSLVPVLERKAEPAREFVFSEYLPDNKAMIRTARWKYIYSSGTADLWSYETGHGAPGRSERLYDMLLDPGERQNLAGSPGAPELSRFRTLLLDVFRRTDPRAADAPTEGSDWDQLDFFLVPPERQAPATAASGGDRSPQRATARP